MSDPELPLDCQRLRFIERLFDVWEGDLPDLFNEFYDEHLELCDKCDRYVTERNRKLYAPVWDALAQAMTAESRRKGGDTTLFRPEDAQRAFLAVVRTATDPRDPVFSALALLAADIGSKTDN